jgi:hypothetical protein
MEIKYRHILMFLLLKNHQLDILAVSIYVQIALLKNTLLVLVFSFHSESFIPDSFHVNIQPKQCLIEWNNCIIDLKLFSRGG